MITPARSLSEKHAKETRATDAKGATLALGLDPDNDGRAGPDHAGPAAAT